MSERKTFQLIMFNRVYSEAYDNTKRLKEAYDLMATAIGAENVVVFENTITRNVKRQMVTTKQCAEL